MKVLIDGRVLKHKYITGVQRYTKDVIEVLNRLDFKIDLAVPPFKNKYLQHLWEHSVLPYKSTKYDILFCPSNVAPLWKPKNCKYVVTIHDISFLLFKDAYTFSFRKYYEFLIKNTLKVADKIITVSNSEKKMIKKYFPKYGDKITVIHNGVKEKFLLSEKDILLEKEKIILYVGSLNKRKNLKGVIEAFLMIKDKIPHKLVIVALKQDIFRKTTFNLDDRIEFLDYLTEDELISLYKKAAVFVFPSLYESFGYPVIEAMGCGCPVVASKTSSIPEIAADAAILVNPYNVKEISDAMLNVVLDKKLSEELIKKGLQRAKMFTLDKTVEKLINVFKELMNKFL
jgi:glycosyltransferase involved in cell wall biosynthesis